MRTAKEDQIIEVLTISPYPMTSKAITAETDIPYPSVARILSKLVGEQVVKFTDTRTELGRPARYYQLFNKNSAVTVKWPAGDGHENLSLYQILQVTAEAEDQTDPITGELKGRGTLDTYILSVVNAICVQALTTPDKDELAKLKETLQLIKTAAVQRLGTIESLLEAPLWKAGMVEHALMSDRFIDVHWTKQILGLGINDETSEA